MSIIHERIVDCGYGFSFPADVDPTVQYDVATVGGLTTTIGSIPNPKWITAWAQVAPIDQPSGE